MGIIRNIISLFAIALLIVCINPAWGVEVKVSGSSTVMPLAEAAAEEFNQMQDEYVVSVSAGGTGAGILGIAERMNDIAMASRRITDEERLRFNGTFEEYLVGFDGISIAVSNEIYQAGVHRLSRGQVREIYLGNITNWKDVGGPDREIYVIAREDGSGTRDSFNEIVLGSSGAETPGVDTVAMGAAEVKTAISGSDRAIGYLGFNYLGGDVVGIAYNGISPTYGNIRLDIYELHRHLYFYTFENPSEGAMQFIEFVLGPEGRRIAADEGFIPS